MDGGDGGEGFFLVLWLVIGFVALGIGLAYVSFRNRKAEKRRDEARRAGRDV